MKLKYFTLNSKKITVTYNLKYPYMLLTAYKGID